MKPYVFRDLGATEYQQTFNAMQQLTAERSEQTLDEIWFTEHRPVFTQGQAGKAEHVLAPGDIPVVQADRGGQVTYHGPGQITGYLMLDLRRLGVTVRGLVTGIEQACVRTIARFGIQGAPRPDAPGVYVDGAKIASLGLRVRRGCSYHGLALNVDMDLAPFQMINPCGLQGIDVVDIAHFVDSVDIDEVKEILRGELEAEYGLSLHTCRNQLDD